jgi:hypothetical protein
MACSWLKSWLMNEAEFVDDQQVLADQLFLQALRVTQKSRSPSVQSCPKDLHGL